VTTHWQCDCFVSCSSCDLITLTMTARIYEATRHMTMTPQATVTRAVLGVGLVTTLCAMRLPTVTTPLVRAFAAPQIMIFNGGPLRKRVVLDDIRENMLILTPPQYRGMAVNNLASTLAHRPFIGVSLFWGPQWRPMVGNDSALEHLSDAKANQRGKLYPARAHDDAILVLDGTLESASAVRLDSAALAILSRHGVPIRVR
jgi:hypothetical protein